MAHPRHHDHDHDDVHHDHDDIEHDVCALADARRASLMADGDDGMNRILTLTAGIAIVLASSVALVHSVRVATAQVMYFGAKYGWARNDLAQSLALCDRAHRLYPHNYYLCILAADGAFQAAQQVKPGEAPRFLALAERWCGTGLAVNRYKTELRLLKTRLLSRESIHDAVAYWDEYVDWHFWSPQNQAVRVELYAQAGDYDKAVEALALTRGSEYYDAANAKLKDAWARERQKAP